INQLGSVCLFKSEYEHDVSFIIILDNSDGGLEIFNLSKLDWESYDTEMTDSGGEAQWYFSQVKGTMEDEVNEADIISTVEFNEDGELLATGDKGGRIVIFQREQPSKSQLQQTENSNLFRTEYNVYSTFQSHEAEFDYLKSLEIEEKINKIKWLRRKNMAHFLLSTNDKTVKLWKIRERNKRAVIQSSASEYSHYQNHTSLLNGNITVRDDVNGFIRTVSIPVVKYMDRIEVEAIPKRVFANAHTYHINSISLNSDQETFMSADDLRINLWHIEITNQSFNIVDIKPANMEELTEVITAAEFHPKECNLFVYSSSKGIIRLCDMRQSALCDSQAKIFEEREDPTTKNFFSEIISSISDVKFSHSGRYLCTRDYLNVKVWDLNMENRPVETYSVHDYLRNKLCVLYENDCIFDKFECSWSSNDEHILTGSYNNFFKSFNRNSKQEQMFECSREQTKPRQQLRPKRVTNSNLSNGQNGNSSPLLNSKRNNLLNGKSNAYKDEVNVDNLDFTKKILHTSWHPKDNVIAIAATNNLYLFYNKENQNTTSSSASYISSYNTNSTPNCFTNNTFTNNASQQQIQNSQSQLNNQIQLNTSFYTAPTSGYTNTTPVQAPPQQVSSPNTTTTMSL
ncbi:unnamed protein product, partial [Brachionus calyciflorus]